MVHPRSEFLQWYKMIQALFFLQIVRILTWSNRVQPNNACGSITLTSLSSHIQWDIQWINWGDESYWIIGIQLRTWIIGKTQATYDHVSIIVLRMNAHLKADLQSCHPLDPRFRKIDWDILRTSHLKKQPNTREHVGSLSKPRFLLHEHGFSNSRVFMFFNSLICLKRLHTVLKSQMHKQVSHDNILLCYHSLVL